MAGTKRGVRVDSEALRSSCEEVLSPAPIQGIADP
jgi:hypothetical protein